MRKLSWRTSYWLQRDASLKNNLWNLCCWCIYLFIYLFKVIVPTNGVFVNVFLLEQKCSEVE